MRVNNRSFRTIWLDTFEQEVVRIIDQRPLPHEFVIEKISSVDAMVRAIKDMHVRGAGLIGAAAAWGMYLAAVECKDVNDKEVHFKNAASKLLQTRPTAVNLQWAIDRQFRAIQSAQSWQNVIEITRGTAQAISDEDALSCKKIGDVGVELIRKWSEKKAGKTVNILTQCNAGWLAFVDYGSATSPIYAAHSVGIDVHVWVDETRPRNQGARLTA